MAGNPTRLMNARSGLVKRLRSGLVDLGRIMVIGALGVSGANADDVPVAADRDVRHVMAFDLPFSSFMNEEDRAALRESTRWWKEIGRSCPQWAGGDPYEDVPAQRKCLADNAFSPIVAELRQTYNVRIQGRSIGGVPTEIIEPADGVSQANRTRVLLNLHGGGFLVGGRYVGRIESIPIAATGKMRVVSIDYRMGPEYKFPAATEDVVNVYLALLREYKRENIGIYGCSAGGLLTAQTIALLQARALELPGAVGMFCTGASSWAEGDSAYYTAALYGVPLDDKKLDRNPYFKGVDLSDPLVSPARSAKIMAKFPPSLLISSTRDSALSSVVHTHSMLVQQGVEADLHVWDGLGHGFFMDPKLSQSLEAYLVIVKFFDRHLGTEPGT